MSPVPGLEKSRQYQGWENFARHGAAADNQVHVAFGRPGR